MTKIISRVLIILVVLLVGWYLFGKSNTEQQKIDVPKIKDKIENKNEENLTFEIKKGDKNIDLKSVNEKTTTIKTTAKVNNYLPKKENNETSQTPTRKETETLNNKTTSLGVFLYEYKIDLSSKTVSAGNIIFKAINTGRLAHNITIKNNASGETIVLGKVAPKETKRFKTNLRQGKYTIFSNGRIDTAHNMENSLIVE